MSYNVAIMGCRSKVGQCMYQILKERNFPVNELRLISPSGSEGEIDGIQFIPASKEAFEGIDIVLSSPGASISKEWSPVAAEAGAIVIDNTSQFRMDDDVPLVVPEVNPEDINNAPRGIIANPNCSTIQMVVALKPLHNFAKITRVVVSTYQSVCGAGSGGTDELNAQLEGSKDVNQFQHQILNNAIPHIDKPQENHYTKEEMKMTNETKKIMHDDSIEVSATCVRVPVFGAHSEAVNIETEQKISREKAIELLSSASGVVVQDDLPNNVYPLPLEAAGKDETFVGRIREDVSVENGLAMWIVADNIRKGAALNAVQIAELWIQNNPK